MKSQPIKLAIIVALLIVFVAALVGGFGKAKDAAAVRAAREREWLRGEGAFFVRKDCISCHSISAFGIKAANIGPDLSEAAVDTQRRFGKSLEEFLHNPSGTMSIVLSSRIPLTDAEKQEAIRLLKIAYQRKIEQSQLGK
ncbi:MAG: hypothetical protein JMDDDDMK_01851 [Acidobacteria bacterium]|nr:hypothetical protein [Acidobacteriota bacterium]